ncbi:MAG: phage adaptor protein [Sulfuriferula sp.]
MNYSELKDNIAAWLHRDDLSAQLDLFIDLFEARANSRLRTNEMQKRSTSTPTTEYVPLPADFIELRNIQINGNKVSLLEYASPQKIDAMGLVSGPSKYYTIIANELQINPSASGSEVEIAYYATIPALSTTNLTNWLIDRYPEYYLMGCVQQALIYTLDDRAAQAEQAILGMEAEINRNSKRSISGPMVVSAI